MVSFGSFTDLQGFLLMYSSSTAISSIEDNKPFKCFNVLLSCVSLKWLNHDCMSFLLMSDKTQSPNLLLIMVHNVLYVPKVVPCTVCLFMSNHASAISFNVTSFPLVSLCSFNAPLAAIANSSIVVNHHLFHSLFFLPIPARIKTHRSKSHSFYNALSSIVNT